MHAKGAGAQKCRFVEIGSQHLQMTSAPFAGRPSAEPAQSEAQELQTLFEKRTAAIDRQEYI